MRLKYLHKDFEPKECNGCMACCHVMEIDEINKPFKTDCIHQCNGCAIYSTRPRACSEFECLFHQGVYGGEEHRPSTCGVMITGFKDKVGEIISAWELWPGAFENNKEMITEFSRIDVIILRYFDGKTSFIGKKSEVRKFLLARGSTIQS